MPFFEKMEDRRHFEIKSKLIEDEYRKVINSLKQQKRLTPRHRDLLCNFIPNLMCRAKPYREIFQSCLDFPDAKEAFLNEITMFWPEQLPILKTSLSNIPEDTHLNYVIGHVMNHLIKVLRSFNFAILKDYGNRGWFTSDNPVVIDPQENNTDMEDKYPWIIPVDSEIYFPLSSDYCAFIFHPKSKKNSNPLRELKPNKVNEIDDNNHDRICRMIGQHESEYFIFNQEIEPTFLDR